MSDVDAEAVSVAMRAVLAYLELQAVVAAALQHLEPIRG